MEYIDSSACSVTRGLQGPSAPVIYVIDAPEHPSDAETLSRERQANVVRVSVAAWNEALTPWPAPGIYRGEPDFGGKAAETLGQLTGTVIPAVEAAEGLTPAARAICGYSLGGLFALYALTHSDAFVACGCLSGSVWYKDWVEHLRELPLDLAGRYAFLSLGTRERRAARPILKTVQDRMEECVRILRADGCTVDLRLGPGSHLQFVAERLDAGLCALDDYLAQ